MSPIWEKDKRTQEVYLPSGNQWRDAWNPDKTYDGGQTISVSAELHQIPIFVRVGSKVQLGDLNKEWQESRVIAEKRPDLASLQKEVNEWFEQHRSK